MSKHKESPKSKFNLLEKIGIGSFAIVYKARVKESGKTVAIKIVTVKKENKKAIKSVLNEIRILNSLSSPYIIEYYEAFLNDSGTEFWIVMEYMAGGDLAS